MNSINKNKKVIVQTPATVANLVCGFDVLGMCLYEPFDEMQLTLLDEPIVIIKSENGFDLPADPTKNTAGAPLLRIIEEQNATYGFEVIIKKNIKPGSGIGSSAASAAGAVVAANHLLGNVFSKVEMVRLAMYGEAVASGVQHADNIAPCIYGGITLIRSNHPLDIVTISSPFIFVTVVHPQIEVRTADARKVLPTEVPLKDAIKQWGNVGGLIAGFLKNDLQLVSRSLEDCIVEPARKKLIPGLDEVKLKSKMVGALGGGISGSGPSIFMLSETEAIARKVEVEMKQIYTDLKIDSHTYVTTINPDGVRVM